MRHVTRASKCVGSERTVDSERFFASGGTDPIFRTVDGATCPSDPVGDFSDKLKAYNLLLTKGLIRIFLPLPAARDFEITAVNDPYGCTALTGTPTTPATVSVYRRPLPPQIWRC